MADRRNYFHGQIIQEGELDDGFDGVELAIWNLAADLGLVGIASGGVVTQHSPTPDLTVDVTSVRAYDQTGRRIEYPSTQTPSLAVDSNAVSTAVVNSGNSKIVSLFVRFKRDESDPRTDDNAASLNFVQDEGFEFVIVQGAEGVSPTPPALLSDGILLADITRTFGQTQIVNGNISTTRRQDMFVCSSGSISFKKGTPEEAVQQVVTELANHVAGVSNVHPATAVSAAAVSQSPTSLTLGTVASQLTELLTAVNARARLASNETVSGSWTISGTTTHSGPFVSTSGQGIKIGSGSYLRLDRGNTGAGPLGGHIEPEALTGTGSTNGYDVKFRGQAGQAQTGGNPNNHGGGYQFVLGAGGSGGTGVGRAGCFRLTGPTGESRLVQARRSFVSSGTTPTLASVARGVEIPTTAELIVITAHVVVYNDTDDGATSADFIVARRFRWNGSAWSTSGSKTTIRADDQIGGLSIDLVVDGSGNPSVHFAAGSTDDCNVNTYLDVVVGF